MNLLKRIYCLFFGHRWLMCRFVWLGQKAPEERSGSKKITRPHTQDSPRKPPMIPADFTPHDGGPDDIIAYRVEKRP